MATFKAVVKSNVTESRIRKGMTIYKAIASDETDTILLTWFNQMFVVIFFIDFTPVYYFI